MKDVLVLATAGEQDERRFAYAQKFAEAFGANLDVVLANELPPPSAVTALPITAAAPPPIVDTVEMEAALKLGAERQEALQERFAGRNERTVVLRVNETTSAMGSLIAGLARTRDTFVCSLPGRDRDLEVSGTILDRVLIEGGRSVIGLPQDFEGGFPIRNVTVAWNGSRESARATAEAMPLLKSAETVTVLLVDQLRRAGRETRPGDDILLHLTRHEVKAKVARVAKDELKTSDAILAEAKRQGADILVIGAQAEGGLLQWLKGSVSRDLLSKTPLPLFMAH